MHLQAGIPAPIGWQKTGVHSPGSGISITWGLSRPLPAGAESRSETEADLVTRPYSNKPSQDGLFQYFCPIQRPVTAQYMHRDSELAVEMGERCFRVCFWGVPQLLEYIT